MKVLWFTSGPCEGIDYLVGGKGKTCGWMYSLCQHVRTQSELELHVAFLWGHACETFKYRGVIYHPILRKGIDSRIGRYINLLQGQFSNRQDHGELHQCVQIVREVSPDIIHIHGSEDIFGLLTQRDEIACPIVLSIQGLLSSCQLKYYSGISRSELSRSESIKKRILLSGFDGQFRNLSRRAKREINIFESLKYVIGRTQWDRRCALALNPNIKYFIMNEMLRSEFMSAEWYRHQPQDVFSLVTTISSGIFKGLEVVYQTAQLLHNSHFEFNWKIIGLSSSDEMVKVVEKMCNMRSNDVHIELLGTKLAEEMVQIMQQADVYVQVSHIENSSNSLCEAMAIGMPIIASNVGGTSSILQDGIEGVLLQDGNPYELAGAILEAKKNYDCMIRMGENARARAMKRHNPDRVVHELMAIYHELEDSSK